jgi:hypothetical protein
MAICVHLRFFGVAMEDLVITPPAASSNSFFKEADFVLTGCCMSGQLMSNRVQSPQPWNQHDLQ